MSEQDNGVYGEPVDLVTHRTVMLTVSNDPNASPLFTVLYNGVELGVTGDVSVRMGSGGSDDCGRNV